MPSRALSHGLWRTNHNYVFGTLIKGTRKNNLGQDKKNSQSSEQTKHSILLYLPITVSRVDQQYDFQGFKFHKYQTYADTSCIQLIHNGHHPSVVYMDYGLSEGDRKKINELFQTKKLTGYFLIFAKGECMTRNKRFLETTWRNG